MDGLSAPDSLRDPLRADACGIQGPDPRHLPDAFAQDDPVVLAKRDLHTTRYEDARGAKK
jgi:hypothetical protein